MPSHKELITKYQEWGCVLVPLKDGDKKPKSKLIDGQWHWKRKHNVKWSDKELLAASRIGIDHEASGMIDLDFDADDACRFSSMLPETTTVGKEINGITTPTHKLYVYDGVKETESLGKNKDCGTVVELLTNTQSHYIGERVLINDIPPRKLTDSEFQRVRGIIRKIYALTVLSRYYPKEGARDEYILRVAGTLARECKHWELHEKEDFIERLCMANDDTSDIKNRIDKVTYQEEQLKLNQEVAGVQSLCKLMGISPKAGLDCIDAIKPESEKAQGITALSLSEFVAKDYPPVHYVLYPLIATETISQIWAGPGVGKTWAALEMACCICNMQDFWKYKATQGQTPYPVLYVEGEMRASSLVNRLTLITQRYFDSGKTFNMDMFYIAPIVEQPKQNFVMLNEELGRKNVELKAEQITKKHGKKPFIFIDNVSCLTNIQEKDAVEWQSFMGWLIKLRARGYGVIFLHHATKAGDTSSGSNFKERAVDLEMKLDIPEDKEKIEGQTGAQFKVSFPKWREFAHSPQATPFIACLNRSTCQWSVHNVSKKTKRIVEKAFKSGGGVKEVMTATGLSQAQVYRYKSEIRKETMRMNKEDQSNTRFKLHARTKEANRQEAEKVIAAKLAKGEIKEKEKEELPF